MDTQLKGQRVLVTGGSKGIGYQIALTFAQEGAHPILVSRTQASLDEAAQRMEQATGIRPQVVAADLSDPAAPQALLQPVGEVDVLVTSAGAIPGGDIQQVDDATWRRAWDLKVFGFIHMTRVFLPGMEQRQRGVILNIIGQAGAAPRADYICGSTGNAALMAFTCAMGGASVQQGVRIFGINPAPTRSDRMESLMRFQAEQRLGDPERWFELTKNLAFGRLIEPDEIAKLAVLCASPLCGYLSGTVINVDGGMPYATPRY